MMQRPVKIVVWQLVSQYCILFYCASPIFFIWRGKIEMRNERTPYSYFVRIFLIRLAVFSLFAKIHNLSFAFNVCDWIIFVNKKCTRTKIIVFRRYLYAKYNPVYQLFHHVIILQLKLQKSYFRIFLDIL